MTKDQIINEILNHKVNTVQIVDASIEEVEQMEFGTGAKGYKVTYNCIQPKSNKEFTMNEWFVTEFKDGNQNNVGMLNLQRKLIAFKDKNIRTIKITTDSNGTKITLV